MTDRKSLEAGPGSLLGAIRRASRAGVDWIQLREKDLGGRALAELAGESAAACADGGAARLIVNDRLDVAVCCGAAGVHFGAESVPVSEAVRWCRGGGAPAGFLIGKSCHSLEEATAAEQAGADYIFFGPIFETPSKEMFGPPQAAGRLAEICRNVGIPVIAIGGIHEENAASCIQAGAAGIAAIRLFQEARDAERLKEMISRLHQLA